MPELKRGADRSHFLAIAARVMRQILVDHARKKGAAESGDWDRTTLSRQREALEVRPEELLALDAAMQELDERQRRVVDRPGGVTHRRGPGKGQERRFVRRVAGASRGSSGQGCFG